MERFGKIGSDDPRKGRDDPMTDQQAEVLKYCNRHQARLLCDLEEAQCPKVYREIVKRAMQYMRHDMLVLSEKCSTPLT